KHAHGVPFILRALGREQRAVGQLERHTVVRVLGLPFGRVIGPTGSLVPPGGPGGSSPRPPLREMSLRPRVRVVSMTAGGFMTYPRASPNQWPAFPVRFEEEMRMKKKYE
ncbi:hypothetical protein, partial [Kocuria sp.]|uniref:hypothetical protein n=1 Tax=Kocuria sp. TaxID=1871328 RepID=UPI0028B1C01F